jgi:two-component system, NtrC family, response regulator AtoC
LGWKLRTKEAMASILVIEDDRLSRLSLTMFLRMRGHAVHDAIDGESAATLLFSMPFDFVISDLHLPGEINGIDILNLANSSSHTVDAILITANGSEKAKEKAAMLGAVYMEKPIELKELARIIEEKLGDNH